MATTTKFLTEFGTVYFHTRAFVLGANTTIPFGTLAMNDAGVIKPAATAVAGSALMGLCLKGEGYVNATGGNVTQSQEMLFARGLEVVMMYDTGDPPVVADIGKSIAIKDNNTVKHTIAGNDLEVTLTQLLPGNRCRVYLP